MAQAHSNACTSNVAKYGNINMVDRSWINARLDEHCKPVSGIAFMQESAETARKNLQSLTAQLPTAGTISASPLGPAEFKEQLATLAALDLVENASDLLNPKTDALAHLLREDNWRNAKKAAVFENGKGGKTTKMYRLVATVISGWEAFYKVSINNNWGVCLNKNGCYSPSSCLTKLEALTAKALEKEFMEDGEIKLVLDYYCDLAETFPGLVLPRFVEVVLALYSNCVGPRAQEVLSASAGTLSGRDSPVNSLDFGYSSGATSPENGFELAREEDFSDGNSDEDDDASSMCDSEHHTNMLSIDPLSEGLGSTSRSTLLLEDLDDTCIENFEKWEDIKNVLEAEAEAAALLPLEERLALPDYAAELQDLEMWLARFRYAIGNRVYYQNWPRGDGDVTAILNDGERPYYLLTSLEIKAMHFKSLKFDAEFPAPAGVEEMAVKGGWNLEEACDSDDDAEDISVDVIQSWEASATTGHVSLSTGGFEGFSSAFSNSLFPAGFLDQGTGAASYSAEATAGGGVEGTALDFSNYLLPADLFDEGADGSFKGTLGLSSFLLPADLLDEDSASADVGADTNTGVAGNLNLVETSSAVDDGLQELLPADLLDECSASYSADANSNVAGNLVATALKKLLDEVKEDSNTEVAAASSRVIFQHESEPVCTAEPVTFAASSSPGAAVEKASDYVVYDNDDDSCSSEAAATTVQVPPAALSSPASAVAVSQEAQEGTALIFYYIEPLAKGNSISNCCSCSDIGTDSCWGSSDDESVELSKWLDEAEAVAEASEAGKKKGLWKNAGSVLGRVTRAAGRKMCRGLKAVLPKPKLACFLMGAAPVLD